MSEMGFENVFYLENFECAGDEVLVESSPPASPDMAARLAAPAQGAGAGSASPSSVRELIVIPELPNTIHLQQAIQQVSSTVVEVNGDSSGHSSPTTEAQHTYIVTMDDEWRSHVSQLVKAEIQSDPESEGGNGVNYHVQYLEPQEIYSQTDHQTHNMDPLRSYPVYGVASVGAAEGTVTAVTAVSAPDEWAAEFAFSTEQPASPAPAPRMPPATVQWLLDHYETAEGVSLPRSTLYAHYLRHCAAHRLEPVNAASFGKLIRSVFVGLRTRRLGTRGNSKYHYYGIRAKPSARDADAPPPKGDVEEPQEVREREPEPTPVGVSGVAHRQYLGAVSAPDPPDLLLDELPDDVPPDAPQHFREQHRQHGVEFLEAVAALDTGAVERCRRAFWRRAGRAGARLATRRDVCTWLRRAEMRLHQRAVDLLLPDVLRPIPSQLTQAIRNFAKSLESALAAGASGAPALALRAQGSAAAALAAALRRYTSLNHLAQAARAVLNNQHQIQQMLSDLNRVDFRVVREQAAWACACGGNSAAHKLEADFKSRLGRGAPLEAWASWLEGMVRAALAPHERRADYTPRARRLLLDWSFYSSLVIRELTLRSAASFGSFHLIRLLYDEYVSFLIERRVAEHRQEPPIAVMQRAMDDDEELPEEPPRDLDEEDGEQDWEWEDDDDEPPDVKRVKGDE
ncbi:transcription factor RFX3 [Bicyclus anynana]|uniref:Transcription factor RFX3 n=1 Tax=Bicyclus anynana TaxID=110368 RepID=A0ABM3LGZ1_BICAN|nr:transcription factor RFX3 [Bicyclus anynana]